ncbi:RNA helicase [Pseudomonas aeruginosa]|uniref:UvrD-helicase domain-containing protein n=1 Tax=Pseudomonas aeruginosa TaxID=287 RepID=UPI00053E8327|nr:UvrD-helicase domain-containing protein [Pseudomonas aeruginosa]MBG6419000.1 UvrD-helicase domain-containing protein [Pseudomonas aeruginosa]MBH8809806.1 UvrD-helicase domain-containing protein [Pseudomonas aeruginosa]MBH8830523.1 UvrD-helicase domain-containing protein [Pseudomonas aeruginosa]MBH8848504.1 UvrD-helicase domain-containing protein [Pseudomonas aeruginosa]
MPNKLCIAGAGSGKTHKIITESIAEIERGGRVLVVTYTTSNQQELRRRFLEVFGTYSDRFVVKGLFSFYLEDMVRPYQQALFPRRIDGICFDQRNPHIKPDSTFMLPGRAEQLDDKSYNPRHFLTPCETKAHTGFLAKLASRIMKVTKNSAAVRLGEIYTQVFFDEVQDLVGWDYEVLKGLNKVMPTSITCVGDFRQTVYETTFGQKAPKTAAEKIAVFNSMGFVYESLTLNRRCIQSICNVADAVHNGTYEATESAVKQVPPEFAHHLGTFIVKESDVAEYIKVFDPMVLRWSVTSGAKLLPTEARCYNFGGSKGLGFDRVLVLPTENQLHFVLDGRKPFPAKDETAQNKLYVAITRARYSLGFIVPDKKAAGLRFPIWAKAFA